MDCHHLHVALRKRLIWVLVLVDATVVEQAQKAVEEVKAQEFTVAVGHDRVVVVGLEYIQQLRKDCKIPSGILVVHRAAKRLKREKVIEIVGGPQIESLTFTKRGYLACPVL